MQAPQKVKTTPPVSFSLHWRYHSQDPPGHTQEAFRQAVRDANQCWSEKGSLHDTPNTPNEALDYANHTDTVFLNCQPDTQFAVCIGRHRHRPCCAAALRVVPGRYTAPGGHTTDVSVAQVMHVCAFPTKHGIGSALMQYLMREVAPQVDAMELKVEVNEDTDALLTFYEKFGFEKQNCQCGVCTTLDPNQDEIEHIQMIYRPTDLMGAVTVLDL